MFCQKLRSAEGCGSGFEMIFVSATIAVNFVCACKQGGGNFSRINALITTQEGVESRRISVYGSAELNLLKLV